MPCPRGAAAPATPAGPPTPALAAARRRTSSRSPEQAEPDWTQHWDRGSSEMPLLLTASRKVFCGLEESASAVQPSSRHWKSLSSAQLPATHPRTSCQCSERVPFAIRAKDEPRTLHKPRRPTPGSLAGTRRRHRATARSGSSPGAAAGRRRGSAPRRCLSPGPGSAQGEFELWQGGDFDGESLAGVRRRSPAADRTACCWGAGRRAEAGVGVGARRRRPCRWDWRSSCSRAARGTRPAWSRGSWPRPPPRAPPTGSPPRRCTWSRRSSCCRRGRP